MSFSEILLLAEKARAEQTARANLAAEARRAELAQMTEDMKRAKLPPRPNTVEDATGLVSIRDAAKYLDVKPDTVRSFAKDGRLTQVKHKPPGERLQTMLKMCELEELKPTIRVAFKQIRTGDGFITPRAAAKTHGIPYQTLIGHIHRGTLPAHQDSGLWVLAEDDVKIWIKQYRQSK